MKSSIVYGVALLGLTLVTTGCATNQSIVRGQSPNGGDQGVQQTSFAYMAAHLDHNTEASLYHQTSGGYQGAYGGEYGAYGAACPPGGGCPPYGAGYPPQSECDGMLIRSPWHPTHHHTFSYEQPANLRYPSNQPGSLVRYPYYTFKGPDDFFHN